MPLKEHEKDQEFYMLNKKALTEYYTQMISQEHANIPMNFGEFIRQERLMSEEVGEKPRAKESSGENQEGPEGQRETEGESSKQLMTHEEMIREERRNSYVILSE